MPARRPTHISAYLSLPPLLFALMSCRVIVLEDSDLLHLNDGAYSLFNAADRHHAAEAAAQGGAGAWAAAPRGKPVAVARALQTLEMEVSQIMKVGGGSKINGFPQQCRVAVVVGC